jgi:hypothetical protein
MSTISLGDLRTHPAIGSWAWGDRNIPYRVMKRLRESGQFWLVLETPQGEYRIPLERVQGWSATHPKEEWLPEVGQRVEVWHYTRWLAATVISIPCKHSDPQQSKSFWKVALDIGGESYVWEVFQMRPVVLGPLNP